MNFGSLYSLVWRTYKGTKDCLVYHSCMSLYAEMLYDALLLSFILCIYIPFELFFPFGGACVHKGKDLPSLRLYLNNFLL